MERLCQQEQFKNYRPMTQKIISIEQGVIRNPQWRMAEPINLTILEGEQIAIVGDNAAGKSRLVEVLTQHYPLMPLHSVQTAAAGWITLPLSSFQSEEGDSRGRLLFRNVFPQGKPKQQTRRQL